MAPAALLLALLAAAPAAAAPPLGAADALRSKQLRLLAFGDSITEGWINSSRRKTPYTWSLEAALRRRLGPKGVDVQVTNAAIGGKGVLDALNDAWYSQLSAARGAKRPYQFIVFMAGINDILIQKRNADDIHRRMVEMWRAAQADGATLLIIPPLPTMYKEGEPTRRELARKIKATIASAAAAGDGSLQLLDLEGPFDWDAMSGQRRAQVFDDGIHLTEWGYTSMLADLIYNGLVKVMAI